MTDQMYLYCAVDIGQTVIKIGVSQNPKYRVSELSTASCKDMRLLYLLLCLSKTL